MGGSKWVGGKSLEKKKKKQVGGGGEGGLHDTSFGIWKVLHSLSKT